MKHLLKFKISAKIAETKTHHITKTGLKEMALEASGMENKLSERKVVHEWLNQIGIPDTEETGKRMCLFRRLAVALGIQPYRADNNS